jgi:hypothetical protein
MAKSKLIFSLIFSFSIAMTVAASDSIYKEIEWANLIPEDDLNA